MSRRRYKSSKPSPARRDLRKSWKVGPPSTKEKSSCSSRKLCSVITCNPLFLGISSQTAGQIVRSQRVGTRLINSRRGCDRGQLKPLLYIDKSFFRRIGNVE